MFVVDFIVRIFLSFIPLNNIAGGEISDTASQDAAAFIWCFSDIKIPPWCEGVGAQPNIDCLL